MALKDDPFVQHMLARCCLSTKTTALELFPDIFTSPFSPLHDKIVEKMDRGGKRVAIAAPRGLGKTSLARTLAAKAILFEEYEFIVYVSNSSTIATMQTENLKRDLVSSPLLKELFGDIRVSKAEGVDESFSKEAWVAFGRTIVVPRGVGQQVRGLNWNNKRPQLVIIDDLEDKEEVRNEENRKNLRVWLMGDLMRGVDKYSNKWRLVYIDTIKHEDSQLYRCCTSKAWDGLILEICGDDLKSNAPDYMSDSEIRAEYELYEEEGELDTFFMELRNIPISPTTASFRREYFKYYDELDAKLDEQGDIENVVIVDPAKTENPLNAESAVVGIGVNRTTGVVYFRDCFNGRVNPDELYDIALGMCSRLRARVLAVETTGLEEFISYPIKSAIAQSGMTWIEFVPLKARTSKVERRIPALIPFYRKGKVLHNKAVCTVLEQQLLSFPKCRRFDVIDAFAYIVELLETGMRYFYKDDDEEPVDEFSPVEPNDEPELTGWRTI